MTLVVEGISSLTDSTSEPLVYQQELLAYEARLIVRCCNIFQVKQQDLAKAIHCLCGRFKIFDEAGYHNLAPDINNFESLLNHYESGNIRIRLSLH